MEKIKALVTEDVGKLTFKEYPMPTAGDYEVVMKIEATALCTLDRRVYLGTRTRDLPMIGGHESSGQIVSVGKHVAELKVGDKAVFTLLYCDQCSYCRTGRGTQCKHRFAANPKVDTDDGAISLCGGLAEYVRVPAKNVIKIPDHVEYTHACFTEPLACCIHSVRKAKIQLCETVVIVGFGIMGYFHLALAKMQGARVIVSEMDPKRIELAKKYGAYAVINPKEQDLKEYIMSITDNEGADVVFNTLPFASVWTSSLELLAPYGRLMCYSSQDSKEPIGVNFGDVHSREIQIVGTLNPNIEDNVASTRTISYGFIDMNPVIDEIVPFEQGKIAFEKACEPGRYRVIIKF